MAVARPALDRGEAVGEVADLDVGERGEGQPALADEAQRSVGALAEDVAEFGAALARVGEGGEAGLKLGRRAERSHRAHGEARLAVGRGAVGGPALLRRRSG